MNKETNLKRLELLKGVEKNEIPPVTLVGNKCDLEDERVVTKDQGRFVRTAISNFTLLKAGKDRFHRALAAEMGPDVGFVETSAKEGLNVSKVFEDIVRNIKANDKKPNKPLGRGVKDGGQRRRICNLL